MALSVPTHGFWDYENCTPSQSEIPRIRSLIEKGLGNAYHLVSMTASSNFAASRHPQDEQKLMHQGVTTVEVNDLSRNASDRIIDKQLRSLPHVVQGSWAVLLLSGDHIFVETLRLLRDRGYRTLVVTDDLCEELIYESTASWTWNSLRAGGTAWRDPDIDLENWSTAVLGALNALKARKIPPLRAYLCDVLESRLLKPKPEVDLCLVIEKMVNEGTIDVLRSDKSSDIDYYVPKNARCWKSVNVFSESAKGLDPHDVGAFMQHRNSIEKSSSRYEAAVYFQQLTGSNDFAQFYVFFRQLLGARKIRVRKWVYRDY